jgi:hypothetical protein
MLKQAILCATGVLLLAATAQAQDFTCPAPEVDCTNPADCFETRYGLSAPDSLLKAPNPALDELIEVGQGTPFGPGDFAGTYNFRRGSTNPATAECLGESEFLPVFGTWILREEVACDPFDTATNPDGCPVQLASDLNVAGQIGQFGFTTARATADQIVIGVDGGGNPITTDLYGSTAEGPGESGILGYCGNGRRVPNPGGAPGSTRVVWTDQGSTSEGGSVLCCNSPDAPLNICGTIGGVGAPRYPALAPISGFGGPWSEFPDWVFEGGANSSFDIDDDYIVPGQRYGVCTENRDIPCDCGPGGTSCGGDNDPCPGLGDTCDLRDGGWRVSPSDRLDPLNDGRPNPDKCGSTMIRFRGTPGENCVIFVDYAVDGDPGPDCSVRNYVSHVRPDFDCNGVDDTTENGGGGDPCPGYSETNLTGDADGDGRGDECTCGDITGDGILDVSDILAINNEIFNPSGAGTFFEPGPFSAGYKRILVPLGDATNDPPEDLTPGDPNDPNFGWDTGGDVDIDDIIAVNAAIFGGNTSCARSPSP